MTSHSTCSLLATRSQAERRAEAEGASKALQAEAAASNATMAAEASLLSQERNQCREERRALGVALLQHKQEVSQHREWLFGAMQTVHAQREQGVYQLASEGAKLEAQKRAEFTEEHTDPAHRPTWVQKGRSVTNLNRAVTSLNECAKNSSSPPPGAAPGSAVDHTPDRSTAVDGTAMIGYSGGHESRQGSRDKESRV